MRRMTALGFTINLSTITLSEEKDEKKLAAKVYKEIKTKAVELRQTWLSELSQSRTEENNTSSAKELTMMLRREKIRTAHRRVRQTLHDTRNKSLNEVTIDTPDGTSLVTTQHELEQACIDHNATLAKITHNPPPPFFVHPFMNGYQILTLNLPVKS